MCASRLESTVDHVTRCASTGLPVTVVGASVGGSRTVVDRAAADRPDSTNLRWLSPEELDGAPGIYVVMGLGSFERCLNVGQLLGLDPDELAGLDFGENLTAIVGPCATATSGSTGRMT